MARISVHHGVATIAVCGELDMLTSPVLAEQFAKVWPHTDVILDLHDLSFMDAMGLAAVIRAKVNADENGSRLDLVGARPNVRRVLEMAELGEWPGDGIDGAAHRTGDTQQL